MFQLYDQGALVMGATTPLNIFGCFWSSYVLVKVHTPFHALQTFIATVFIHSHNYISKLKQPIHFNSFFCSPLWGQMPPSPLKSRNTRLKKAETIEINWTLFRLYLVKCCCTLIFSEKPMHEKQLSINFLRPRMIFIYFLFFKCENRKIIFQ